MRKSYQSVCLSLKNVIKKMLLTWRQFHLLFSSHFENESEIAQLGTEHTFTLNRLT